MVGPLVSGGAAVRRSHDHRMQKFWQAMNYGADQKDSRSSSLQKVHSSETTSLHKITEKKRKVEHSKFTPKSMGQVL